MNELTPGLVSVTFRKLTPPEIIALAVQAQTPLLEWGGDIHVPHGDVACAREVGTLTRDAGLTVTAYGSYYRAGSDEREVVFARCLDSATALGAPRIRIWAGTCGSAAADEAVRAGVVADLRRICRLADEAKVEIACEYHGGTLTDTVASASLLLSEVDCPNFRTLWQPLGDAASETRVAEIATLAPRLANVHVYYWPGGRHTPLNEGASEWQPCLTALAQIARPIGLLLEFVRDASP